MYIYYGAVTFGNLDSQFSYILVYKLYYFITTTVFLLFLLVSNTPKENCPPQLSQVSKDKWDVGRELRVIVLVLFISLDQNGEKGILY